MINIILFLRLLFSFGSDAAESLIAPMHPIMFAKKSKKDSKDQESIKSSTTPIPGYQLGK